MPGVPEAPDTHDGVVNVPPVKPMLRGELLRGRLADDEMSNRQGGTHYSTPLRVLQATQPVGRHAQCGTGHRQRG